MRRCIRVLALAAASVVTVALWAVTSPPASADPGYVQLNVGTMSPQYLVNGCRYKIVYGNYGAAPVAGVRLYGGCSSATVGVRSVDGGGVHWTWSSSIDQLGTDGCGSFAALDVVGPSPGFGTGAYIIGTGTTGSFWKFYDDDGTDSQPIHSTC